MDESRHLDLVRALVGLADTLTSDYDTIEFVQTLVDSCVDLLEVDAAGLMLSDQRGGLSVLASSSPGTRMLELFALQNDEGPCVEAFHAAQPVTATDLTGAVARWPTFAPAAQSLGYRAVFALPLRLRENVIGALNLFRSRPGDLPAEDRDIAQALADTATIGILTERAIQHQGLVVEQLQGALDSRVVIEQAKGVLAARDNLTMDQAFTLLRTHARSHHRHLTDLALAVVSGDADINSMLGTQPVPASKNAPGLSLTRPAHRPPAADR